MFKGVRAQLFFGFGALVIVINLFYYRLTFLFVEVTEDSVARYVLDKEIERLDTLTVAVEQLASVVTPPFRLEQDKASFATGKLQASVLDDTLFRFTQKNTRGHAVAFTYKKMRFWLTVQPDKLSPLVTASDVFSVFLSSISVAVICLGILATWFLASMLSRPLRSLTKAVYSQEPEPACSIDESGRKDEIGQLARAFEDTYGSLQKAWRREHDFASDVSHELRTPIALIKNILSLSRTEQPILNEDRLLLEQSTTTLQNTVEVLLALARRENLVFTNTTVLPIVERVLLSFHHAHESNEFEIDLCISSDMVVSGNANLIMLLFQNLVNNGFYHGGGNGMTIYQAEDNIIFENTVSTRQRGNYQGLGHGQYLVARIADVMGWSLSVEFDESVYRVSVCPLPASSTLASR